MPNWVLRTSRWAALPLVGLVWAYQRILSPDHSWRRHLYPYGYCRFVPSCSSYAQTALKTDGIIALPSIVARLGRCHPWHPGGVDYYHSRTT